MATQYKGPEPLGFFRAPHSPLCYGWRYLDTAPLSSPFLPGSSLAPLPAGWCSWCPWRSSCWEECRLCNPAALLKSKLTVCYCHPVVVAFPLISPDMIQFTAYMHVTYPPWQYHTELFTTWKMPRASLAHLFLPLKPWQILLSFLPTCFFAFSRMSHSWNWTVSLSDWYVAFYCRKQKANKLI